MGQKPICPKCGIEARRAKDEDGLEQWCEKAAGESPDYFCAACTYFFGAESAFRNQPNQ